MAGGDPYCRSREVGIPRSREVGIPNLLILFSLPSLRRPDSLMRCRPRPRAASTLVAVLVFCLLLTLACRVTPTGCVEPTGAAGVLPPSLPRFARPLPAARAR